MGPSQNVEEVAADIPLKNMSNGRVDDVDSIRYIDENDNLERVNADGQREEIVNQNHQPK